MVQLADLRFWMPVSNPCLANLTFLTEALQKAENHSLAQEEEIIEKERKRIARDLHDTVSQELFAAHMILSGVSQQVFETG